MQVYGKLAPPTSVKAIEALIYLVSARRSAFPTLEILRNAIETFFTFLVDVCTNGIGFQYEENLHIFARLVAQMQLTIHTKALEEYGRAAELVGKLREFTVKMIMETSNTEKSIYYLMSFWSALANTFCSFLQKNKSLSECICANAFEVLKVYLLTPLSRCPAGPVDPDEAVLSEDAIDVFPLSVSFPV